MSEESEKKFDIIFTGNISGGADLSAVKEKAAHLFRLNDTKLAALFCGKRTVLKKNIDNTAAQKYQKVLNGIGMITVLQVHGAAQIKKPSEPTQTQLTPTITPPSAAPSVSASRQDWDVLPAGELGQSASGDSSSSEQDNSVQAKESNWAIEKPGAQLSEPPEDIQSDIVLPNITVAPIASDLLNDDEKEGVLAPLELPAIADISVASTGDDLLSKDEKTEWVELPMELGHIKVKTNGGDLLADHEKAIFAEKVINTDSIHLKDT